MSQQEIEVILSRQLAEYLALPIFIVDPSGESFTTTNQLN